MGIKSEANWEEVMANKAVTEATRMAPSNTARRHTDQTDEQILKNLDSRIGKIKHILNLSMAEVNANK